MRQQTYSNLFQFSEPFIRLVSNLSCADDI
jgi:hypothetical protein